MMRVLHDLGGQPAYWCPVCKHPHRVAVRPPFQPNRQWTFNGNYDKPTFSPSVHVYIDYASDAHFILARPGKRGTLKFETAEAALAARPSDAWEPVAVGGGARRETLCHVHITDGKIHILADSKKLGGKTLPLEPWDKEAMGYGPD
jgi:hypothetical protein